MVLQINPQGRTRVRARRVRARRVRARARRTAYTHTTKCLIDCMHDIIMTAGG